MKISTPAPLPRRTGFTLIELLVVIAVIGILAALLFPITGIIKKNRVLKVAQAELENVATAIEAYKSRRGVFPPDNPGNFLINPLYFELEGTLRDNSGNYQTLNGSSQIMKAEFLPFFGPNVTGFVNASASAKGDDEKAAAENFLKDLKPAQSGVPNSIYPNIRVLACSVQVEEPASYPLTGANPAGLNPWRYVSTHPTNNPSTYDLWVDVMIGGKKYTVSNWGNKP